ncbi:MAG: thioredoxin domain-containing protein [Acidobacteria bacterium]|nr:thioredoxin domain-containing protein [Acidobacteriota bacterium]
MSKSKFGCALALVLAALGGSACADAQTAQAPAPAAGTGDQDQVVATVGDRKFTLKDVEARWQEEDPAERARVSQLLYQHRRQSIDMLVGDYLIEGAAKKAGLTKEKYLATELEKRRGPITDADIQKVFDENRDRVGASTVTDLKDSIAKFIAGNRDAQNMAIMVNELKAAGPAVSIALDPPRYDVAIAAHDPARGQANAPITIVEFSEYQCPFCARVTPTLKAIEQKYAGKVRLVFKDFPLQNHLQAPKAAEAAHCAGDQGKYWELHDRLFANQQLLQVPELKKHAAAVGLDQAAFDQCLDSGRHADNVQADIDLGTQMGVGSTPTLYINGRLVTGAQPLALFESIIDEELARKGGK